MPEAGSVLPALARRPPQVRDPVGLYRLLASQGKPSIRLPEPEVTAQILRTIAARTIDRDDLSTLINEVADDVAGAASTTDVKDVVVVLARGGILKGDPADAPLQDRTYRFATPSPSAGDLRQALLSVVRDKLAGRLGTVDEEVLHGLVLR